jgi:peptide/nickel transport system permease protein
METVQNNRTGPGAAAWRVHGLLRLLWSPQAQCPMPRKRHDVERGRLSPLSAAFQRYPALYIGIALIAIVTAGGLVVPILSPYAPDQIIPDARLLAPSAAHPFGTDALGRDLLSRIAAGASLAARIALFSVAISLVVGLVLGSLAGYYTGWVDQLISRTMDGWLSLPGALVAVVIVARLGASLDNLVLALGIMGVPAFYRIVRNTTLSARQMPYAEAAIALGATDHRVMWQHVFPNILSPVVVLTSMRLGTVLLTGSSLSFIGLGAQPPAPEWGSLLATGRNYLGTAWWLAIFPGLAMTFTVVGLNLIGDGLRDMLDPRGGKAYRADGASPRAAREPEVVPKTERIPSMMEEAVIVLRPRGATVAGDVDMDCGT